MIFVSLFFSLTNSVQSAPVGLKISTRVQKSQKNPGVVVRYIFENTSGVPIVFNRFCTLQFVIFNGETPVVFHNQGSDHARKIMPADVVVVAQGSSSCDLVIRFGFLENKNGTLVLTRESENGDWWVSDPVNAAGKLTLRATYRNSLTIRQLETIAPTSHPGDSKLAPDMKLPAVDFAVK